jgi:hypothetical protein
MVARKSSFKPFFYIDFLEFYVDAESAYSD